MTRSDTSFGLAVEDRGGMVPCLSVHLSRYTQADPQWPAISQTPGGLTEEPGNPDHITSCSELCWDQ